jgi:hypothetical protein
MPAVAGEMLRYSVQWNLLLYIALFQLNYIISYSM